ncbi:hypothetical protein JYT85_01370 [Desulfocapsa sp. AH-315-G09]|nr:hypothetical protein [Desulfocapsa sp.]MBN4065277.1 hypothetical protein [Desulfocapsa sp. AH-315-G09]
MAKINGWKTYVAAAGMGALGVVAIANGDVPGGIQQLVAALALVGIGHKIEKSGN